MALKIRPAVADTVFSLIKSISKKPLHIAVVAPSAPRELFDLLWKGVWSAAFELAPFGVRVERFETNGHDVTAQKRILANLRTRPPAALVISPAHHTELDRDLELFAGMRIPVTTFHTDAPSSGRELYIGADPAQSGALAGEILGRLMGGTGSIASFPGPLQTEHLKQRYLAFRKELKENFPAIQELVSHSGYNGLGEAAAEFIGRNPLIGGIYVGCSRSYEVASVTSRLGRKMPFVGFDLTERSQPFLVEGAVSALIDEDVYHQGYLAVHQAFEGLQALPGTEPANAAPLPARVMLRANCQTPESQEQGAASFENLVRARTRRAFRYQEMLDEASSRIVLLSETDSVTGLSNRAKFEEVLSAQAQREDKLAILIIGLDGFERGKHRVGQTVWDEVLRMTASTLKSLSRPTDHCARIGDNEFSVLMPGANQAQAAAARRMILSALAKAVIAPHTLKLGVRVSAGAACFPADATTAEDLLVYADRAMCTDRDLTCHLPDSGIPAVSGTYDRFQM